MSETHDENGKFKKGNGGGKLKKKTPKEILEMRKATRDAIISAAFTLLKPVSTVKQEVKEGKLNRLEYIIANAISKNNFNTIKFFLEYTAGKPLPQVEEKGDTSKPYAKIVRTDGSSVEFFPDRPSIEGDSYEFNEDDMK